MKKTLFIALGMVITAGTHAQSVVSEDATPEYQEATPKINKVDYRAEASSSRLIWSEDFSNGIPMGWSQNGTPNLALWEYRGPNTVPNDTVGSIGCWAGPNQSGNTGDPIASPTRSNGFIIFDSDFYHSNGNRATNGSGPVPAPHVGRLRTGVIDLSAESGAELSFYNYARRFQSAWYVAISIDGGLTFTDTLEVFPASDLPVNSSTDADAYFRANISGIVANQSQVVMEFIFDGNLSNANGSGRYYWMIDDIELNTPPDNFLLFTSGTAPGTTGLAPAQDIIFDANSAYPKYMHLSDKQIVPITFDANIYNYGTNTQTNVALEVEIRDASNAVVATVTSPAVASLNSIDTAYYTTLTTPPWTPTQAGNYSLIYKAVSDSLPSAITTTADTFNLTVSDKYSLDDGVADNYFGTNSSANDMTATGVMFSLEADDPTGDAGFAHIQGVEMLMSCLTDSTADMEFAIFDTAGFVFNAGFPASAQPLYTKIFTFDGSIPCNTVNYSFEDNMGRPLTLPTGTYYVVATFFPNAVDGVIRIANSASFGQPALASVFQTGTGDWFGGFTNSTTFEAPHFRLIVADASDISLTEDELADFSVYPNPTTGKGFIEFGNPGNYELSVHNMVGDEMHRTNLAANANEKLAIDFSHLSAGVYLVTLKSEGKMKTVKLTIQ
jgi:hypothetical protein